MKIRRMFDMKVSWLSVSSLETEGRRVLEGLYREQWEEAMKRWRKGSGADRTNQPMNVYSVQGDGCSRRSIEPRNEVNDNCGI